jgi:SprB repeat
MQKILLFIFLLAGFSATAIPTGLIITDASANGNCTGEIHVDGVTGTEVSGPFDYLWSNSNGQTFNTNVPYLRNLCADDYSVTITNDEGCQRVFYGTVNYCEPLPTIEYAVMPTSDNGTNDGGIRLYLPSNINFTQINWMGGNSGFGSVNVGDDIEGITRGFYLVVLTYGNGCTDVIGVVVGTRDEMCPIIGQPTISPVCPGESNGAIDIRVHGGIHPYAFEWSNGATTQNISGLAAGTYIVKVTSKYGCEEEATYTVPELEINFVSTPSCIGQCNGSIRLIPVNYPGFTAQYLYEWASGGSGMIEDGLCAGQNELPYVLIYNANFRCELIMGLTTIGQRAPIVVTGQNGTNCTGSSTAGAIAIASGGSLPYSYHWSNGSTGVNFWGFNALLNVSSGNYVVTATDRHGCEGTQNFTIGDYPAIVLDGSNGTNCNSGNTAGAYVIANGGEQPYRYLWSNGSAGINAWGMNMVAGLSNGNYTVTVTDGNGCTASRNYMVGEMTSTGTPSGVACGSSLTGSITMNTTGGVPPYTYQWRNIAQPSFNGTSATDLISGLSWGGHSITVTDATGCSIRRIVVVAGGAAPNPGMPIVSNACGGNLGSINYRANLYTYLWNDGQTGAIRENLTLGNYTVTISLGTGCPPIVRTHTINGVSINNINHQQNTCTDRNPNSLDACDIAARVPNGYVLVTDMVTGATAPYNCALFTNGLYSPIWNYDLGIYQATIQTSSPITNFQLRYPDGHLENMMTLNNGCSGNGLTNIPILTQISSGNYNIYLRLFTCYPSGNYCFVITCGTSCIQEFHFNHNTIPFTVVSQGNCTGVSQSCSGRPMISYTYAPNFTYEWNDDACTAVQICANGDRIEIWGNRITTQVNESGDLNVRGYGGSLNTLFFEGGEPASCWRTVTCQYNDLNVSDPANSLHLVGTYRVFENAIVGDFGSGNCGSNGRQVTVMCEGDSIGTFCWYLCDYPVYDNISCTATVICQGGGSHVIQGEEQITERHVEQGTSGTYLYGSASNGLSNAIVMPIGAALPSCISHTTCYYDDWGIFNGERDVMSSPNLNRYNPDIPCSISTSSADGVLLYLTCDDDNTEIGHICWVQPLFRLQDPNATNSITNTIYFKPNPFNSNFVIDLGERVLDLESITIWDMIGTPIPFSMFSEGNSIRITPETNLSSATYYVRLAFSDGDMITLPIVKL